jgi:O-antigen/teichoic acid export membrane protein
MHAAPDHVPSEHESSIRLEIWRFSSPLIPYALVGWLIAMGDRFFLALRSGVEVTGIYVSGYALGSQLLLALSSGCLLAFRPRLYDAVNARDAGRVRRELKEWLVVYGLLAACGVIGLAVVSGPMAYLALGPRFRSAASIIPLVGLAHALQGFGTIFETMIYAQKRTRWLVVLQSFGGAVAVALYWILIPTLGMKGAALGTVGGYAASLLASMTLVVPSLRLGTPPSEVAIASQPS